MFQLERLDSDLLVPSSEAGTDYEQLPSQYKEMLRTRERRRVRAAAMENASADADRPVDDDSDGDGSEAPKAQLPDDIGALQERCIKAEVERDEAQRERDEAQHELAEVLVSHDETYSVFQRTSAVMSGLLRDMNVFIALVGDDDEESEISMDSEEGEEEKVGMAVDVPKRRASGSYAQACAPGVFERIARYECENLSRNAPEARAKAGGWGVRDADRFKAECRHGRGAGWRVCDAGGFRGGSWLPEFLGHYVLERLGFECDMITCNILEVAYIVD
ncbi:hypothetical protein GGX14DRAFT_400223 [Mycena pura]|uniref:Uncharacterized protein n=1 Tax=Mycena pura TaxID=153505 RepID=A0AAD6V9R4_9AGAR|nr:hypothetical protein GGX14DRAFT_400223 [Mycena pura]